MEALQILKHYWHGRRLDFTEHFITDPQDLGIDTPTTVEDTQDPVTSHQDNPHAALEADDDDDTDEDTGGDASTVDVEF